MDVHFLHPAAVFIRLDVGQRDPDGFRDYLQSDHRAALASTFSVAHLPAISGASITQRPPWVSTVMSGQLPTHRLARIAVMAADETITQTTAVTAAVTDPFVQCAGNLRAEEWFGHQHELDASSSLAISTSPGRERIVIW